MLQNELNASLHFQSESLEDYVMTEISIAFLIRNLKTCEPKVALFNTSTLQSNGILVYIYIS